MPAPRQCTLPTPCDRGYGPMRGCGLCRGNVHGGVVHARGGVALWRGWGIPLKGAALGSCQTRPSGDIRLPALKKTTMELGLPENLWRWTRTVTRDRRSVKNGRGDHEGRPIRSCGAGAPSSLPGVLIP